MPPTVTVLLFVKGTASSDVENLVAQAQCAAALDTLAKMQSIAEIGPRVVATANAEFATRAETLGARIALDPPGAFHFGARLATLAAQYPAASSLYIGGGSGALMTLDDWRTLASQILRESNLVIPNNFYSCDFCAWSAPNALALIEPPDLDNDLAFRLGERAGLRVVPLPKNAATQLDLDTPTDLLTIAQHPSVGAHLRAFLDTTHLDANRITRVQTLLGNRAVTLLIAGRVSAAMALYLERATACQWRILSEERGMRASGRQARGEVRSLLGAQIDHIGAQNFIIEIAQLADAALIDSRVLFAHRHLQPAASDRFYSDLLMPNRIRDPFIRELTRAVRDAPIPIILGGHSLVSGGMYALVEKI